MTIMCRKKPSKWTASLNQNDEINLREPLNDGVIQT